MEGVVLHDNEQKCWDLMQDWVFMHHGIPHFYDCMDATLGGEKMIIMFIIVLRRSLCLKGLQHQQLQRMLARP